MKNTLLFILIALGVGILTVGIQKHMLPPMITGIGFFVIAGLFYIQNNND